MVVVGRDLCGSSNPTPLPKQGHLFEIFIDIHVHRNISFKKRKKFLDLVYLYDCWN